MLELIIIIIALILFTKKMKQVKINQLLLFHLLKQRIRIMKIVLSMKTAQIMKSLSYISIIVWKWC